MLLQEALLAGAEVVEVFATEAGARHEAVAAASRTGIPVHAVTDRVMEALSDAATPQGVVAAVRRGDASVEALVDPCLLLVLADVRDPGNAGTLVRSAVAAGADAVVFGRTAVDPLNPKTLRASAGAIFHVPVVRDAGLPTTLGRLRARGLRIVGAEATASTSIYDLDPRPPLALVLGNEAWGIAPRERHLLDQVVGIPMPGPAESLNVAVAGSLLLFQVVRGRSSGG